MSLSNIRRPAIWEAISVLVKNVKGVCLYTTDNNKTIVYKFKRLGSRCFYDLFERCYFFFLNRYAYSKTKPLDIWG